jgi:hypothetical protein
MTLCHLIQDIVFTGLLLWGVIVLIIMTIELIREVENG